MKNTNWQARVAAATIIIHTKILLNPGTACIFILIFAGMCSLHKLFLSLRRWRVDVGRFLRPRESEKVTFEQAMNEQIPLVLI